MELVVGWLFDPKSEFNSRIDAPIETENELRTEGIGGHILLRRAHQPAHV
jgi:hypothetical protein